MSTLLGETVIEAAAEDLKAISEKLEVINLQLARRKAMQRKALHGLFIIMCASIVIIFAVLTVLESPYLGGILVTQKPPLWGQPFMRLNGYLSDWHRLFL